ncbi:ROK family protein [Burkholderiaceae bacterium DAT-1]|nr:ROK family protein [Burkholderiaceae bacterium DAT-1]
MHVGGIDIGGTKIELAVYNDANECLFVRRVATPGEDYEAFLSCVISLVNEAELQLGTLSGLGVGIPGLRDPDTGACFSSNIPAINGRCVAADLESRLKRTVVVGNDCQLFALSEANGGSGSQSRTVFGAILGTGAGAGICVDGVLIPSRQGISGEWGHMPISAPLQIKYQLPIFECGCGLSGCLERYISGTGIAALYRHQFGTDKSTPDIVADMRAGDVAARQFFAMITDILGYGLANIVLVLDPGVIVLGGGLSLIEEMYSALPSAIQQHIFKAAQVPPVRGPYFGDAGATRGAALLFRQYLER